MTKSTKKGVNFTYQALALMSRLFYKKFGDAALPIIRDVWYQMGLASGKRLKGKPEGGKTNEWNNAWQRRTGWRPGS